MVTIVMMMTKAMLTMPPRTNPTAKQLHCVMVRGTAVDVTGCIILLQFCPKLTKVDLQWIVTQRLTVGFVSPAFGYLAIRKVNLNIDIDIMLLMIQT